MPNIHEIFQNVEKEEKHIFLNEACITLISKSDKDSIRQEHFRQNHTLTEMREFSLKS